jgi:hypothetical protein
MHENRKYSSMCGFPASRTLHWRHLRAEPTLQHVSQHIAVETAVASGAAESTGVPALMGAAAKSVRPPWPSSLAVEKIVEVDVAIP